VVFEDVAPEVSVTKTANPTSVPETGGNVTFTFQVENTGVQDVTLTSLTDDVFGDLNGQGDCVTGGLIPIGGSYTCSMTTFLTGDPLVPHVNVATATVEDGGGTDFTDTDDATVTFTVVGAPGLTLVKTALDASYAAPGDVLDYQLVATNSGTVDLTNVTIVDPLLGALSCTPAQGSTLTPGATMTCTGSYTVTQADVDAGSVVNVATADSNETDPVTDGETVLATRTPGISITKTALSTTYVAPGDVLEYELVVRNTGNVTLTEVTVSDPLLGSSISCSPAQGGSLAPGATMTCTGSYTVRKADIDAGSVVNVATADSSQTEAVTGTATVIADPVADISVEKVVDDPTPMVGDVVRYTVTVENLGPADATGLVIEDRLPSGLELVDVKTSHGEYDPKTGRWDIGDLAVGDTVTMTMDVRVTADGDDTLRNIAAVAKLDQTDVQEANDRDARDIVPAVSATATTGADVVSHLVLVLVLVLLGGVSLIASRRRDAARA
jgi:uncharacterized repeat protein (TIGR01451 family)